MAEQLTRQETGLRSWWEDSPLTGFRQEMNQLLSRFFGEDGGLTATSTFSPSLDLSETEKDIEVRIDLPGFKPEEIDVEITKNILTISGEHSEENEEKDKDRRYHSIECRRGSFRRSVQLPAMVQDGQVDAHFKEGVLTVTLPKSEEGKPKKVSVKG